MKSLTTITRQGQGRRTATLWKAGTIAVAVAAATIAIASAGGCTGMGDALLEEHGVAGTGKIDTSKTPDNLGLVGDWLLIGMWRGEWWDSIPEIARNYGNGQLWTFTSSGLFFDKYKFWYGDFWVTTEHDDNVGTYVVSDENVSIFFEGQTIDATYKISRDTLTFVQGDFVFLKATRDNDRPVYSTDTALYGYWALFENQEEKIHFDYEYGLSIPKYIKDINDSDEVSTPRSIWYANDERNKLFVINVTCDNDNCTSRSVIQRIELDYTLDGDTLRIRPADSNGNWDTWIWSECGWWKGNGGRGCDVRDYQSKRPSQSLFNLVGKAK
jgi:hypothetical protein